MKYTFHPDALAEYAQAVEYYAEQHREIAQLFIDAIEAAIYRIREFPYRYPVIANKIRRCLVKRFPYGILYIVESEQIIILAVMHCSREPNFWQNRQQ